MESIDKEGVNMNAGSAADAFESSGAFIFDSKIWNIPHGREYAHNPVYSVVVSGKLQSTGTRESGAPNLKLPSSQAH